MSIPEQLNSAESSQAESAVWVRPLAATLMMQTVNAYLYFLVPTLAPIITGAVGQGPSFVGWLAASSTLGSIVFLLAGMPIVLRLGPLRTLQFGTLAGALGVLLLTFQSVPTIVAGNILMGLGYGPASPAGSGILHRFAPGQHRNLLFSIRQAGVPASGLVAGLALPALYGFGGWKLVIGTSAAVALLAVALVQPMRTQIDCERDHQTSISPRQLFARQNLSGSIRAVNSVPGLRRIAIAGACLGANQGCWVAYLVTYLTVELHETLNHAGMLFAAMQAAGIFGRPFLGWLADRIGSGLAVLRVMAFASAATSAVFPLFASRLSPSGLFLLVVVAGVTISSWNGVQAAVVASIVPRNAIAVTAAGTTAHVFSGFLLGPAMFSLVLEATASYEAAFGATVAITLLAGLLLATAVPRPAPPQLANGE